MSEDVTINIRDIQHYMYCPRRFALLEVNDDWAENAFVVKANLLHENVHSGERNFKISVRSSEVTCQCITMTLSTIFSEL